MVSRGIDSINCKRTPKRVIPLNFIQFLEMLG